MKHTSEIVRSELKQLYKSDRPLKDTSKLKNNNTFSESELIPCVKLLYEIYIDNLKSFPNIVKCEY